MKIAVVADEDSFLKNLTPERVDVLVSCGDLPDAVILKCAEVLKAPRILAVKGNHDSSAGFCSPIIDLHLDITTVNDIRIAGFHGAWKYKPRGNYLYEQEEVERFLSGFPKVDIFVAHNSPRNIHDRDDQVHHGFDAFNSYIERTSPTLFIHGHQHANSETVVGNTRVVGVFGFRIIEL